MADFELTTYISNCLLLSITLNIYKKRFLTLSFLLNLTHFLLNLIFFQNAILSYKWDLCKYGFYSFTDYKVNDETYSLDKLATSYYYSLVYY